MAKPKKISDSLGIGWERLKKERGWSDADVAAARKRAEDARKKAEVEKDKELRNKCIKNCDKCGGYGVVKVKHPDFPYGKLEICPNNPELQKQMQKRIDDVDVKALGLPVRMKSLNWDALMPVNNTKVGVEFTRAVLDRGFGWVFLHGANGLAKSLIGQTAVATALRAGESAAIAATAEILLHLRASFGSNDPSEFMRRLELWQSVKILVVEEISEFKNTEFAAEQVRLLLNKRWQNAAIDEMGVTIFTSEQPPDILPLYLQDRLRDERLHPSGNCVLELKGASVRPQASVLELD